MVINNDDARAAGGELYLREWRLSRGWTLEQVGEKIGRDKSTVSDLETGKQQLTLRYIQDLAAIYGVRPPRLFSPPDKPSLDDLVADLPSSDKETIVRMIAGLKRTGTDN